MHGNISHESCLSETAVNICEYHDASERDSRVPSVQPTLDEPMVSSADNPTSHHHGNLRDSDKEGARYTVSLVQYMDLVSARFENIMETNCECRIVQRQVQPSVAKIACSMWFQETVFRAVCIVDQIRN